jgi:quercetin dioxygenase-like cupin family protein
LARVIKPGDAKDLGLKGRVSKEIISGSLGSDSVTLRLVEIPPEVDGEMDRQPHFHRDTEECIYVLSGKGAFCTENQELSLAAGDTVLVPKIEPHFTRNTGKEPLVLLCFFPVFELQSHG